ncbi:hypothetical protein AU381_11565 [Sinorhizobium glycinis]|uniref:Uncharacterized protein n=2 Tax=Sinorhizobium TaxID=28105 RepID=I3XGC9_SINF2|nr:hypothetical protein USDA257_p02200 [Sinorhizobium fredii USDA 257]OAP35552.1 hypothetical protein AU381_11565 [Sinorhizobium glycinis]CEO91237.1 hypothetical protein SFHH103_psfHH103d_41 [Sinorhizobium fredii HH103]
MRSGADVGGVLIRRSLGRPHGHCQITLTGCLLGVDLIASGFQVDFSPDRMFFSGQATPIFDLDDERFLFRLHDGPIEKDG